ncbi:MAG: serine/threonine-protein kinase [Gammaproteobacteria bacterium]
MRELPVGTVIGERYELRRRVAGGSMGVVYKALDLKRTMTNREASWVAVKLLTPRLDRYAPALRGFRHEAETGLALNHPNIVRFHGLEQDGERFYIVMEWLPGCSLADWLDGLEGAPMPEEAVERIVQGLGAALSHAHGRAIVHADVKPGNVMLLPDGGVRLCDFGIARPDAMPDTRAADGSILRAATPAYSSPQVLQGKTPTVRDDVYSLGCVVYRMLAGHRVYGNRNAIDAHSSGEMPRPIETLEPHRWEALRQALSYRRSDRQRDVATFVREVMPRRRRRGVRPLFAVLLILLVLDAAAALALYLGVT